MRASVRSLAPLACALLGGLAPFGTAAQAGTGKAKAQATVVRPYTLVKEEDLSFGNIVPGATAGTVTLDPADPTNVRVTGGVKRAGGITTAARFKGAGTPGRLVFVRWSTAAFPVQLRNAGGQVLSSMSVEALATNYALIVFPGNDPRIIPPNGVLDILFGARLNVGANQPAGDYEGQFTVTVDYL